MSHPINNILHGLMEEWREGELSDREAATAFRAVALVAVAEYDAVLVLLQDTDSGGWERRYRTLSNSLLDLQNCPTDRDVVSGTLTITNAVIDFLAALDGKREIK